MQSESRVDISKQTLNPGKPTVPTYKQGNLLIQLLAAMVIMGIIMAFTLPNINTYTDRANGTQVLMDFKEFQLAAILLNTENGYPKFNTLDTFLGKLNENLEVDYKFSLTPDGKQAVSNLKDPYDYTYKLLFKDNLEDRSVSIIFTSTGGTRVGKSLSLRNFKDKALATSGEISYTLSAKLYGKGKIVELTTMEEEALLGQAPPSKPDGGNKPTPTSNPTPPPTSTPPPINPTAPPIPGDSPNLYPGKIVGIVGDGGLYSYYYSSKVYGEDGWVHSPYANEYSGMNELYHHQNDASGEKLQTVLKQWGGRIPQPEKYKMSNLFINCNFGKLNIDFTGWDLTSKVSTDLCKKVRNVGTVYIPPYFGKSADIPGLFGYSTVNKMIICNNSLDSSDSDRTLESAVIGELWICDNVGVNLRGTISPVTFLKNGNVTKLNVGKSFMRGYKVDMGGLVADRLELDSNSCRKGVILKNAKIGTVILADNFGADCTDLTEFFVGAKIDNLVIGNNAFANASIFTNMFKGAVIQNITIGDNFGASATTLDGIFSSLASDNFTVGRNFCVKATRIVNALQSAILGNTSVYEGTFLNSAHADYNYYITMLKTVTSGKYTNLDI